MVVVVLVVSMMLKMFDMLYLGSRKCRRRYSSIGYGCCCVWRRKISKLGCVEDKVGNKRAAVRVVIEVEEVVKEVVTSQC